MHKSGTRYMFTTEGHVVSVDKQLREAPWREDVFPDGGPDGRPPDFKAINSSSNVSGFFQGRVTFGGRENPTNLSPRVPITFRLGHLRRFTKHRFCRCRQGAGTPGEPWDVSLWAKGAGKDNGHESWTEARGKGGLSPGRRPCSELALVTSWDGTAREALDPSPPL